MVLIMNSLPQTMMDFPALITSLNGFGHLSKPHCSVQVVRFCTVSACRFFCPLWSSPGAVEAHPQCLYQAAPAHQRKGAHFCVCSPWGGEGRVGKKQQLPAGSRSLQGQPVPGAAALGHPACCLPPPGNTPLCSSRLMQGTLHQAISDGK